MKYTNEKDWLHKDSEVFWGEISPCDHLVQIYDTNDIFLNTLTCFVSTGLNAGESCVIVATQGHIEDLELRLKENLIDIDTAKSEFRYLALEAEKVLQLFMVQGWPDEDLFNKSITGILHKVSHGNKVRVYGEMVAILWAQGFSGATVHLEHLWHRMMNKNLFSLFCAYPKAGFTEDINTSIDQICRSHTMVINGSNEKKVGIEYKVLADDPRLMIM